MRDDIFEALEALKALTYELNLNLMTTTQLVEAFYREMLREQVLVSLTNSAR